MFFSKKENKNDNKSNLIKIAALLIHTAKIDEIYTNKEKEIIKKTLLELGALEEELEILVTEAE